MGIQAVKGVEIGDGFALAARARLAGARRDRAGRASAADEPRRRDRGAASRTASTIVVRAGDEAAADADAPARQSVDLATRRAGAGARRAQRRPAVEALAVVAEAAVAWELARAAREKFGGDALVDIARRAPRLPRAHRRWRANA